MAELIWTEAALQDLDGIAEYVAQDAAEDADGYEINWVGEFLSFAIYWNSTGRFPGCGLEPIWLIPYSVSI
jgi:hypothetical protein